MDYKTLTNKPQSAEGGINRDCRRQHNSRSDETSHCKGICREAMKLPTARGFAIFKFERKLTAEEQKIYVPNNNFKYGPYLYKNTLTGELIASWDFPKEGTNILYKGENIGITTDALHYRQI